MRVSIDLNEGWLFGKDYFVSTAKLPSDNSWQKVSLPHTWNAVDGHDGSAFERGAYWYVTSFNSPKQPLPGGKLYVEIGAAAFVCEVWVNGQMAGKHVGGYSAFYLEITDLCRDGENVLSILCDNTYSDKYYPQRADFTFYGGLYRGVRLISVAASHFALGEFGGTGIFVDAVPDEGGARIKIRANLQDSQNNQTVGLSISDAEGNVVGEVWAAATSLAVLEVFLPEARLWNGVEDPYLYVAQLRLVAFNEVLDEVKTSFGIRSFEVDPERGFILNGKPTPLRGVCRHQDRLYKGNALTREEHEEDARIIADMGANCIRLAHYQQSPDIYDACDRLGLVVWAEIAYFPTSWDDEAHAAAVNEIKEMCVQNYNHPSICFWGLSNEVLMGQDHPKLVQCHRELEEAVKDIDTGRLTVVAHEYNAAFDHPLHDIADVEGWNHYFGWYRGELNDLGRWMDTYHQNFPTRRISISEYGCDGIIGYHTETPVKTDYTEEYQARLHENACEAFALRPWVWGAFVWNMFDFGSHFRREGGTRGRNNKGLVTMDRKIKKDAYYVHKAWYSKQPFVHIAGRRFFERPGSTTEIRVYSNLSEVSLFLDGKHWKTQKGSHVFVFADVPLQTRFTSITAKTGDLTDTITLRGDSPNEERFVFSGFRNAQDAKNWFDSIDEAGDGLENDPDSYSINDSVGLIAQSAEARKIVLDSVAAVLGRSLDEDMIFANDPEKCINDLFSTGFFASMFGDKGDLLLKRMNIALGRLKKPD